MSPRERAEQSTRLAGSAIDRPNATPIEIDVTKGGLKVLAENYEGRHWALVYGDQSEKIKRANDLLGIESLII